jgi:hypothetical protein
LNRFQFQKRSQLSSTPLSVAAIMVSTGSLNRWIQTALSIGLRNKTLSAVAMRVNNPERSPAEINR